MPEVQLENIEKMDAPVRQRANLRADTRPLVTSEVEGLDREIDQLVAPRQLYGLSPEEIDIVKGKG